MLKKIFTICLFCFALLALGACCSSTGHAASTLTPKQAVDKIAKYYKNNKSMQGSFEQVMIHKASGNMTTETTGKFVFQSKPMQIRWETLPPQEELIIVTDKVIWNYIPDENVVYKYAPSALDEVYPFMGIITGQDRLDKSFKVTKITPEAGPKGSTLLCLDIEPRTDTQNIIAGTVWIKPEDGSIVRLRTIDVQANSNDITLISQQLGVTPPKGAFEFTPPAGVDIEDNTR